MLPKMNEEYANYVLSVSKNGLHDMVRELKVDKEKDSIITDLQPSLVEKFSRKFPDVDLVELENAVYWIILKSHTIDLEEHNEHS